MKKIKNKKEFLERLKTFEGKFGFQYSDKPGAKLRTIKGDQCPLEAIARTGPYDVSGAIAKIVDLGEYGSEPGFTADIIRAADNPTYMLMREKDKRLRRAMLKAVGLKEVKQ